jgi:uncharacterized protein (TIGR02145 family)
MRLRISLVLAIASIFSLMNAECSGQQGVSLNTSGQAADVSAILDVSSTSKGLLIPRMTTFQRNNIDSPAISLLIFNSTTNCFEAYVNGQWYSLSCSNGCGSSATLTDIERNVYNIITIGTQCWMKENLNATNYSNGDLIPNVTDNTAWNALTTGAYSDYANMPANSITYGRLYNWYAVNDSRGLCPTGWHIPSHDDWTTLEREVCTSSNCNSDFPYDTITVLFRGTDEGNKLKESGTTHWNTPNTGATNSSGFTALPGGYRYVDGNFYSQGDYGFWWSSKVYTDRGWSRSLNNVNSGICRTFDYEEHGFSVRCLRN